MKPILLYLIVLSILDARGSEDECQAQATQAKLQCDEEATKVENECRLRAQWEQRIASLEEKVKKLLGKMDNNTEYIEEI